jgi:FkbM family methyltransferase
MKKRLMTFLNLVINACYGRNIKITTSTGEYLLRTTFGHPLKRYLRNFERYDRFLPFLSKAISKSVIDIGSNIGDTLVLIKSISNAEVVCVEPDEKFISYLKQNIELNNLTPIKLYPYPISSIKKIVAIEKNGLKSTSNTSEVHGKDLPSGIPTKTFQDLLTDLSLDIKSIGIIKSDTDGYDWDCLNSIADYFDSAAGDIHYPEFIFYEHQPYLNNLGRKDPDLKKREQWYANSLSRLVNHGYTEFYIFDNFGSLIHQIKNTSDLFTILDNLIKTQINKRFSNYFVDVLLTQPATHHFVEKALRLQTREKMVIN